MSGLKSKILILPLIDLLDTLCQPLCHVVIRIPDWGVVPMNDFRRQKMHHWLLFDMWLLSNALSSSIESNRRRLATLLEASTLWQWAGLRTENKRCFYRALRTEASQLELLSFWNHKGARPSLQAFDGESGLFRKQWQPSIQRYFLLHSRHLKLKRKSKSVPR